MSPVVVRGVTRPALAADPLIALAVESLARVPALLAVDGKVLIITLRLPLLPEFLKLPHGFCLPGPLLVGESLTGHRHRGGGRLRALLLLPEAEVIPFLVLGHAGPPFAPVLPVALLHALALAAPGGV